MADNHDGELDLIERARSGEPAAIAALFEQYYAPARQYAGRLASDVDPDDVVAEAFVRVIGALRRGTGPHRSFRAYLFTAVKRQVIDQSSRARREALLLELSHDAAGSDSLSERVTQSDVVQRALLRLPARWREVLWRTEVEGLRPEELGEALGIGGHAATSLAFRAREGFRLAVLAESMQGEAERAACADVREDLPRYVRASLSATRRRRVRQHLDECSRCAGDLVALEEVNRRFRSATGLLGIGALLPALATVVVSSPHVAARTAVALRAGRAAARHLRPSRALHLSVTAAAAGAVATVALATSVLDFGDDPGRAEPEAPASALDGGRSVPPSVLPPGLTPPMQSPAVVAPPQRSGTVDPAPAPRRAATSVPRPRRAPLPTMVPMEAVTPDPGDRPGPPGMPVYCSDELPKCYRCAT